MRFFHRFESINYKFLALVNGILLSSKKKTKHTSALKYLEKYSYVLNDIKIQETSNKYQNKIWQLWLQGEENMPPIVKQCHKSVKFYHDNDVILLDNNSLDEYIQLPDFIREKYKKGIITHANYSDMIRLMLLSKYGGCWVDSTIYLTNRIPNDILNADFFTFKSLESENLNIINSLDKFELFSNHINKTIDIESPYFISAKAGNIFTNALLNLFFEYWKNEDKLIDYLMIDKFFIIATLLNKKCFELFNNMPKYYIQNVLMLQNALFEPFDKKTFDLIKQISPIHKLTHKNLHRNPFNNSFLNELLKNQKPGGENWF